MAKHTVPVLTPAQEARIREIVAEMIGQWSAGAGERLAKGISRNRPEGR